MPPPSALLSLGSLSAALRNFIIITDLVSPILSPVASAVPTAFIFDSRLTQGCFNPLAHGPPILLFITLSPADHLTIHRWPLSPALRILTAPLSAARPRALDHPE
jgi:hypothetical protein